jgi:hypothetical protein
MIEHRKKQPKHVVPDKLQIFLQLMSWLFVETVGGFLGKSQSWPLTQSSAGKL